MDVFYPESSFGGFTRCDGTVAFYQRVNALLGSDFTVLDVGCGRGEYGEDSVDSRRVLRVLRGKCQRVIGLDRDRVAADNPFLDEFRLIDADRWPVDDESVDLCLADNVLEHLEEPERLFTECGRVLRSGGCLCIRTPNTLGYATAMAQLIPNAAHAALLRRVQPRRNAADVFPTLYRCNTQRRLHAALTVNGFEACVFGYGTEPSYLEFSKIAYALGAAWASVAPSCVQNTLFAFARRVG
jgi:SAM-dependent methyltransferase